MNILLPVDGSPLSMEAVHHAIRLVADGLKANFVLANVQEPSSLYEMVVVHDPEALRRVSAEAGAHALSQADALLAQADIEHDMEVAIGQPAHTLIDIIERYECDAVIMGAHGMGESGAAFGAVAQELLRHSPVPVMIVRPQQRPESDAAADSAAQEQPDTNP
ncbi:MAG TPA: universal stress protein [Albitalea sp.]|uniref:universal stress protein n=1 Tax=Piscinibacter sp. TaxID=1903157 RepID=UPI002ED3416A